jgi:hypothetical protein
MKLSLLISLIFFLITPITIFAQPTGGYVNFKLFDNNGMIVFPKTLTDSGGAMSPSSKIIDKKNKYLIKCFVKVVGTDLETYKHYFINDSSNVLIRISLNNEYYKLIIIRNYKSSLSDSMVISMTNVNTDYYALNIFFTPGNYSIDGVKAKNNQSYDITPKKWREKINRK